MPTAVLLLTTVRETDRERHRDRLCYCYSWGIEASLCSRYFESLVLYRQAAVTVDAEAEDLANTTNRTAAPTMASLAHSLTHITATRNKSFADTTTSEIVVFVEEKFWK